MLRSNYLPHVDGLRAIAVLAVIFFHLDIVSFQGGYVGVDVFFVISGFLITGILREELEKSGSLNLKKFYGRRMKRLMPALLVTLSLTFLVSALVFSPVHLQRIGGALSASILSVSNFYFWFEADYFDVSANLKPLLHTWSLSVEEQFYFFWPALLFLSYKVGKDYLIVFVLISSVGASLFLNHVFHDGKSSFVSHYFPEFMGLLEDGKSTLFFLLPFRVFEFGIGALLVWVCDKKIKLGVFDDMILWLGLGLISYSIFYFNDSVGFSYWSALLPCIGSALVIFSGAHANTGSVLRNSLMTSVGLISYSLYLVHWPIIVFSGYLGGDADYTSQAVSLVLTFVIGFLLFFFVEKPFRSGEKFFSSTALFSGMIVFLGGLFSMGAHAYANNGWSWRVKDPVVSLEEVKDSNDFHQRYYGGSGYPYYGPVSTESPPDIIVLGDSHGRQYAEGLYKLISKPYGYSLYIASGTSCFHLPKFTRNTAGKDWAKICPDSLKKAIQFIERAKNPPLVIVSHYWNWQMSVAGILDGDGVKKGEVTTHHLVSGLLELSDLIGDSQLLVVGNVPGAGDNLYDIFTRPRPLMFNGFDAEAYLFYSRDSELEMVNSQLSEAAFKTGSFLFIDPFDYLCDENRCRNVDDSGRLLYSDHHHLSKFGSIFLVDAIEETLLTLLEDR